MKSRTALKVEVFRGPLVECVHEVMFVVADERGQNVHFAGNYDYVVYPRSSVKMLQAIPFLESGACQKFGLDDRMVALACSSHRGEKVHVDLVQEWFKKINLTERALRCGAAWPANEIAQHDVIKKGLGPSPIYNNCSGKHLGMLSGCLAYGDPIEEYQSYDHPYQDRIRKLMSLVTKQPHDKLPWGIDGCGMPTYAIPLTSLAHAMQRFIAGAKSQTRNSYQTVVDACRAHPVLVSGANDFVSQVNEVTKGQIVIKSGAEGVYTGMIFPRGFTFALKVQDGSTRAAAPVIMQILRECDALKEHELKALQPWVSPELKNGRNEKVGEIRLQK